jgi:hypothetical protein
VTRRGRPPPQAGRSRRRRGRCAIEPPRHGRGGHPRAACRSPPRSSARSTARPAGEGRRGRAGDRSDRAEVMDAADLARGRPTPAAGHRRAARPRPLNSLLPDPADPPCSARRPGSGRGGPAVTAAHCGRAHGARRDLPVGLEAPLADRCTWTCSAPGERCSPPSPAANWRRGAPRLRRPSTGTAAVRWCTAALRPATGPPRRSAVGARPRPDLPASRLPQTRWASPTSTTCTRTPTAG